MKFKPLLSNFFFAFIILITATMLGCDDEEPIQYECCAALCAPSVGTLSFIDDISGLTTEISGTIKIKAKVTQEVLLENTVTTSNFFNTNLSSDAPLTDFENQNLAIIIEVTAEGYEPFVAEREVGIKRVPVCCDSCLQSSDTLEIRLMPTI